MRRRKFEGFFQLDNLPETHEVYGVVACRVVASGVRDAPETARRTAELVAVLEADQIEVRRYSMGSPANVTSHHLEAQFLDGGLYAGTGRYWASARGAWVYGSHALAFVAKRLGLTGVIPETPAETDEDRRILKLEPRAARGDPESECALAYELFRARGPRRDQERALALWSRAASTGYLLARYNLASCYARGLGVRKSARRAFGELRELAAAGYWRAKFDLAVCYWNGLGTRRAPLSAMKSIIDYAEDVQGYSNHGNESVQALVSLAPPSSTTARVGQLWLGTMADRARSTGSRRPLHEVRWPAWMHHGGFKIVDPNSDAYFLRFEARHRE